MTPSSSPGLRARSTQTVALGGITVLVLIAFVVPFLGLAISLSLPFATHAARRYLWRDSSATASKVWSWVAWTGLWWPGVLSLFAPFGGSEGEGGGLVVSTIWLVIPLCMPAGVAPILLPAALVAVLSLAGLLGAATARRAWPWAAALWLAPWAHHLVFSLVGPEYIC